MGLDISFIFTTYCTADFDCFFSNLLKYHISILVWNSAHLQTNFLFLELKTLDPRTPPKLSSWSRLDNTICRKIKIFRQIKFTASSRHVVIGIRHHGYRRYTFGNYFHFGFHMGLFDLAYLSRNLQAMGKTEEFSEKTLKKCQVSTALDKNLLTSA